MIVELKNRMMLSASVFHWHWVANCIQNQYLYENIFFIDADNLLIAWIS